MGMERGIIRLMRTPAQALASSSSSGVVQRGAALVLQTVREYVGSTSSAFTAPSDGFSHTELSDSTTGKRRPIWQGWSRGYADSSIEKGNVEYLEFGTHKTATAKRFAVGTTAVDVDEVQNGYVGEETKEKAKEILQEVGEIIDETVEEAKIKQLQAKLVATEGIGEVVQELYNQQEEHSEYSRSEAGGNP